MGQEIYTKAGGRARRAHYAGDIYICKNFTTHIFNTVSKEFRMEEYPNKKLIIPNNKPAKKCKPYSYGLMW